MKNGLLRSIQSYAYDKLWMNLPGTTIFCKYIDVMTQFLQCIFLMQNSIFFQHQSLVLAILAPFFQLCHQRPTSCSMLCPSIRIDNHCSCMYLYFYLLLVCLHKPIAFVFCEHARLRILPPTTAVIFEYEFNLQYL